jgi:hypothetical protein
MEATAEITPDEFFRMTPWVLWSYEAGIVLVLGGMAYWDVSIKWIVVAATVCIVHTIGGFVFDGMRRLEGFRLLFEDRISNYPINPP